VAAEDVCNLRGDEREQRAAMIRAEILPLVRRREDLPNGFALEFERTPSVAAKLARWVELERTCCASLDWELELDAAGDRVRLSVRGEGAHELARLAGASRPTRACGC
jgi:hypothetical protein